MNGRRKGLFKLMEEKGIDEGIWNRWSTKWAVQADVGLFKPMGRIPPVSFRLREIDVLQFFNLHMSPSPRPPNP
jgi:hypothetical protein